MMSERISELSRAQRPNINKPKWDQSIFLNRARHFLTITNPVNLIRIGSQLDEAKRIVEDYRLEKVSPNLTVSDLWKAKHLYDSAFHPETHEKMTLIGRMSAQVPMNMTITGCMMTFYRTTPAVFFWQWTNQSFNALVNYTNRSGQEPIPTKQLMAPYLCATGGALVTAIGLNSLVKSAPPLIGRFVPWLAVATANCINIPMMRSKELREGIVILDEAGNKVGESQIVAKRAIGQVVLSRIVMATPGMVIPPFVMNYLDTKHFFRKRPYLNAPIQISLVGLVLLFSTPLCCALFPQISSISTSALETDLKQRLSTMDRPPKIVYYNKGL